MHINIIIYDIYIDYIYTYFIRKKKQIKEENVVVVRCFDSMTVLF